MELEELKGERAEQMAPYGDLGGIGSFFYRSVMSDYRTGVFKVAIPDIWAPSQAGFSYSLAHIYEEEVPALEWEMTGEHSEVASFDCQKAECDFRGRRWEAWFTPEIPVSEGPWQRHRGGRLPELADALLSHGMAIDCSLTEFIVTIHFR